MSLLQRDVQRDAFAELSCFRTEFYACLTQRPDALFELSDALLCADGPVFRRLPPLVALLGALGPTGPVSLTLIAV
ncbi:hypothetical protein [Streptomyces sp. NPDC058268]|uniref:hypothetical protein n=1 Tax=Streptomyces sp. NPDC058268 TaxID=3346413 RepID=UPI0036F16913